MSVPIRVLESGEGLTIGECSDCREAGVILTLEEAVDVLGRLPEAIAQLGRIRIAKARKKVTEAEGNLRTLEAIMKGYEK